MLQRDQHRCSRSFPALAAVILALLPVMIEPITAQSTVPTAVSFEYRYGGSCIETGYRRVDEVRLCGGGGGYVAVGISPVNPPNCTTFDIYVVRMNNLGAPVWQFTYDIAGANGDDGAYSIKEISDGSGFIVAGRTNLGTNNIDAFLMKIDCNGGVLWTNTYGGTNTSEEVADIIEAASFTPGNPYDFVVAGRATNNATGATDGYLLRTNATGGILWDGTYDQNLAATKSEWLRALTEADLRPGQTVGDIIAVGGAIVPGTQVQGYMIRVDGVTGRFTGGLHGAGDYGGTALEEFTSVIELKKGNEKGNVVAIGYSTEYAYTEIYMVKTRGNPCDLATPCGQRLIGHGAKAVNEEGYDVKELMTPYPKYGADLGDLILTGRADDDGIGLYDMFLLAVDPCLDPIAGTGRLYNSPSNSSSRNSGGYSLAEVTGAGAGNLPGFIMCGYAQYTDATFNNQQDVYIVKTNTIGHTGCDNDWEPESRDPEWPIECPEQSVGRIEIVTPRSVVKTLRKWGEQVCPSLAAKSRNADDNGDGEANTATLRSFPNPVKCGTIVTLELAPTPSGTIMLSVSNEVGQTVYENTIWNDGTLRQLTVGVQGWPAGVYQVTIDDGEQRQTARIVVVE